METKIIPYEPIHAYTILDRNIRERDLWLSKYGDFKKFANGWKTGGPAFTLVIDGEIVGCGGVTLLEWDNGEAWTLFSSLFSKYSKIVFKTVRIKLEEIIKEKKLKRIQAFADSNNDISGHFLKHLGFEKEGTLKQYGPLGENLSIYGRT